MKTSAPLPAERRHHLGGEPAATSGVVQRADHSAAPLHHSPRQATQRRQLADVFGPAEGVTVQRIGAVRLRGLQAAAQAKHGLMLRIAEGIQMHRADKLKLYGANDSQTQKTIKVNMALAGRSPVCTAAEVIHALVPGEINDGALRLVIEELATMPAVDADLIDADAIGVFSYFTKEGYENVTGVARGGTKYDKALKGDRPMRADEVAKGQQTLQSLVDNWAEMPKFTGGTVYRVVHAGTGEDALAAGASLVKANPTSTSVALDWSRAGPGKVCCKIVLKPGQADMLAVDTRAVSTYTHEGEILLTPGTQFTKLRIEGDYTLFEAQLP